MKKQIVRKEIIRAKIKEIEEGIELIKKNLPFTFDEFSSLGLIKDGIYKRVEFCIENIFDICAIINTDMKLGIPESDESIVENLVKHKILNAEIKGKLKMMKGFRNILVHRYGKVDDKIAYEILSEHIDDFYVIIEKIEEILNTY